MSGGHWQYREHHIREIGPEVTALLEAAAQTEHIIDWAICGDTRQDQAKQDLWDLWEATFNKLYGNGC